MQNRDLYFMGIAVAVGTKANCLGRRVGAVIVVGNRVVSTGYNGTPSNMTNCLDGGCDRCADSVKYLSGTNYDICVCVHAEQNALLSAARFGIAVEGGEMFCTMRPCFGCTKELIQAGIVKVYYRDGWTYPDPSLQAAYEKLQNRIPNGVASVTLVG